MAIKIKTLVKKLPVLKDPILIEGLPGIGNVGKVAVDFMIDELDAKKIMEITSYSFPNSVFVNEQGLIDTPMISLYCKTFNGKKRDLLFLAGDVQPVDEEASYEFSNKILDILEEFKGTTLITLGGIGLPTVPEQPKVYCTSHSKKHLDEFKKGIEINSNLYGIVGPIIGVTGLLVGLSQQRKLNAICILAETYGHPMYLGIKGAKEILNILNKKLDLKLDLKSLGKEIEQVEAELLKKTKQLAEVSKKAGARKLNHKEAVYIG